MDNKPNGTTSALIWRISSGLLAIVLAGTWWIYSSHLSEERDARMRMQAQLDYGSSMRGAIDARLVALEARSGLDQRRLERIELKLDELRDLVMERRHAR